MCPYADLYCCWFRIPLYWRELHYRSGLVLEASPRWPTACLFPALHPLSCVLKSRTTCGLAARIAHRISSTPMRAYVCWVQNSIVVAIHFREDAAFRDRQRRTPPLGIMPERKSYREAIYSSTNWNLKTIKLWVIIALHRLSIKSSKSLENKGFIAMCSPYPFIWFHTSLLFPCLLIRAKSRARKSHNKI